MTCFPHTGDRNMIRAQTFRRAAAAIAGAILLLTFLSPSARAQDVTESHLKAARAAVAASNSTGSLDDILPRLAEQAKQNLITNRPDAADQINVIVNDVAISLAPRRADLEDEVARAYARIFTEAELNEIAAFYLTETGKKLIAQTPDVARSIDQAARVWTNGIQRDLRNEVGKKLVEAGLQ